MTPEQVQNAIKTAFPERPIPKRTILGPLAPQDRLSAKTFERELVGKTWQSLTPEFLATRWSAYCYLSAEAYRYYLPALLMAALKELPNTRGLLHSVVFDLRPSFWLLYYEGTDDTFQSRQAAFTIPQYHAVCAFLGWVFNQLPGLRHLAAQALHWGWNRRETPSLQAANLYYRQLRTYVYPEPDNPEIMRLYREIGTAFATTPYPGDDKLCGSEQGNEPAEDAMELRGLKWQSAHPVLLARCYTAMRFLSDAGFRYFLPAYLLADLAGSDSNADPVVQLVYGMEDKTITWRQHSLDRFKSFNREERRAIIHYLEYQAKDYWNTVEINQALESYWRPSVQLSVM